MAIIFVQCIIEDVNITTTLKKEDFNMKVMRTINATINAVQDRVTITKKAGRNLQGLEKSYYQKLVTISGPSVHKPNKVLKSFLKAYKHQIEKLKIKEQLDAPFKHNSRVVANAKTLLKGIIGSIKKG